MQLAADPIVIEITGEVFELRPTLRAAFRLTSKHGDLATLYRGILADHVTIVSDVIREATGSPQAASDYLLQLESRSLGLRDHLAGVKSRLCEFIRLYGTDPDDDDDSSVEHVEFEEFYARLFEIGTGWLGWSAHDTWEASPAEILAAQKGRAALIGEVLKSVFGGSSDDSRGMPTPVPTALNADGTDPSFDREGYASLRAKFSKAA